MGREIVYCWKCAKRIDGAAFEKREAFRYGDKVSCEECVLELVADLPAEQQEAILNADPAPRSSTGRVPKAEPPPTTKRRTGPIPTIKTGATTRATAIRKGETAKLPKAGTQKTRAITRAIPKSAPPPETEDGEELEGEGGEAAARKKKLILIGAGGGGLLLVAVVVILILLMGGKKAPPPAPDTAGPTAPSAPKPDPKKAREEAAKKAMDGAMAVFRDKAEDLGAQLAGLEAIRSDVEGSSLEEEHARQVEIVETKMNGELSKLDGEATPLLQESRFKAAKGVYEAASTRYDHPRWKDGTSKKLASIDEIVEDRFLGLKKNALAAKENGEQAKVDEAVAKVAAFEMPELLERLKKDLGAVAAAPAEAPDASKPAPAAKGKKQREIKALPTDLKNYWPGFQRAMGLVSLRDFEAAAVELRRAAKDADTDLAKEAFAKDLELFDQAKAVVEGAGKTLGQMKRLAKVAFEIQDRPGEFKVVEGLILAVNDQRAEVRSVVEKDGKKIVKPLFVEWLSLSGKTLADQLKTLRGKAPSKEEALGLALLCLSEGNEEAAEAVAGGEASKVADRFWAHAPEAKEKAPKSSREFEARALFHAAETDWRDVQTWGAALEKYKQLQNEFAGTLISRNNSASIGARSAVGKEYSFHAYNLQKSGFFKAAKKPEPTLQSTKDAEDLRELQENFVEAPFYALPGLTYRCWALIGGCCKETFTFYYQTTGGTTSVGGKTAEIDPGGNMAAPVPIQLTRLAKDHAAHKPKDPKAAHPKDAVRWEWIPIPFPRSYSEHGPKAVRLMSDQQGFAVKFIVVSSVRTQTPNAMDTSAYLQEIVPGPADEGVTGDPEPKQWFVCGPFNEPLNTRQAPEGDVDLAKEFTGKNNTKFKWKLANAEIRGERAKFDWDKNRLFNPKDNVSAYALIHVKAPESLPVQIQIGHDDGGRVWLNGQLVHSKGNADFKDDAFKASAQLEEGWNRVLVKVQNGNAGFGFVIRIVDGSGKPIEGLQYSAYGDELFPP